MNFMNMEKEGSTLPTSETSRETDVKKETPAETIAIIYKTMETWKKIPDSHLLPEDRRTLVATDPEKAKELKRNKYGKGYFNLIANDLYMLLLINDFLKDSEIKEAYAEVESFVDKVRLVDKIQESQIDEFEELVKKVINIVPNKENN